MAGLLDMFNLSDDPNKNSALWQGLLSAGFGAMAGRGNTLQALGQGGLTGLAGYGNEIRRQEQSKIAEAQQKRMGLHDQMTQIQLEEALRRQKVNALPQQFMRSPESQALAGGGGPTVENAQKIGDKPGFDMQGYLTALEGMDPLMAMEMRQKLGPKPSDFKTVGGSLVQITPEGKVSEAYRAPEKEPEALRALKMIHGEGSPAYQQALQQYGNKLTTHRPATNINVNTAKPLLNTVAEGLGKQIDASLENARAATGAINTAQTLKSAIDSGKVIAGPGSSWRVFGLQIGQMLGVGGKDSAEILGNTRKVIQSMAQAELDTAKQMKGQGQITEAERDIIRRAASGNIDDLTAPEVYLLADAMEKIARQKIAAHRTNLEGLRGMQGAEPLLPFYSVEEPAAYTKGAPRVRKYNPATGKIE